MMLQALVALAEREGLMADTDFETRRVDVSLKVDRNGKFLGAIVLGEGKGLSARAPIGPAAKNNPGTPAFIVDNLQYVLGIPRPREKAGNAAKSFDSYRALVEEAAAATNDLALRALLALLRSPHEIELVRAAVTAQFSVGLTQAKLEKLPDALPGKVATIYFEDDPLPTHERPIVEAWWRGRRATSAARTPAGGVPRICLITGEVGTATLVHDVVKGLPGAPGTGAKLISFNRECPAFTSHGFEQGENAPVSARAAQAYVRALEHMLEREPGSSRPHRQALSLPPDSAILFWTREANETPGLLLDLFDPRSETASDALRAAESPWRGIRPSTGDDTSFYACTLAANMSRVVVREWIETTAADVKRNVARYFDDLTIAGSEGEAQPLRRLLGGLEATAGARDPRGVSAVLASRLFTCAIRGTPFPRELLGTALRRLRVPPKDREPRTVLRDRVAIVKASLLRLPQPLEVTVSLDPENRSIPYLLGRLFAACERLQGIALGDLNATIRDRYFGAASSTPAVVFPRLIRLSMHHASKAQDKGDGWAERIKADIVDKLPSQAPFPRAMSLEEQGLFAVGYYHQREAFFTKRSGDAAKDSSQPSEQASTGQ